MHGEGCESYVKEAMRGADMFTAAFMKISGMGDSTENPSRSGVGQSMAGVLLGELVCVCGCVEWK